MLTLKTLKDEEIYLNSSPEYVINQNDFFLFSDM